MVDTNPSKSAPLGGAHRTLTKDLHVVIGVLLLQQLHDLSDAETVEALAFNMAWRYALDVRSEADSYFCEKTLRNYRRLFIEQGLDELLFRCLTDRMVQGFSVDTSHQRMDSTALRSAMRALTRLGIVVESISKFARELERYHPGLIPPSGMPDSRWGFPSGPISDSMW